MPFSFPATKLVYRINHISDNEETYKEFAKIKSCKKILWEQTIKFSDAFSSLNFHGLTYLEINLPRYSSHDIDEMKSELIFIRNFINLKTFRAITGWIPPKNIPTVISNILDAAPQAKDIQ